MDKYENEFQEGEALDQALEDDVIFHGSLRLRATGTINDAKEFAEGYDVFGHRSCK